jgi:hypothetical protein
MSQKRRSFPKGLVTKKAQGVTKKAQAPGQLRRHTKMDIESQIDVL